MENGPILYVVMIFWLGTILLNVLMLRRKMIDGRDKGLFLFDVERNSTIHLVSTIMFLVLLVMNIVDFFRFHAVYYVIASIALLMIAVIEGFNMVQKTKVYERGFVTDRKVIYWAQGKDYAWTKGLYDESYTLNLRGPKVYGKGLTRYTLTMDVRQKALIESYMEGM